MRQRGDHPQAHWFSLQRPEALTEMLEATMGDPGGIARNKFDCACACRTDVRNSGHHHAMNR